MTDPAPPPLKTCPRCQKRFSCCAGTGWCTTLTLPATLLETLRKTYTTCLCKECLLTLRESRP